MKNFNRLMIVTASLMSSSLFAQDDAKAKAEAVFLSSCGVCHDASHSIAFVPNGVVDWDVVKANAEGILREVEAGKMPPPSAPPFAKITEAQKSDLLAYVQTLVTDETPNDPESNLSKLSLPKGFSIAVMAKAPGARSMAVSPEGLVFVGTGGATSSGPTDKIYGIIPGASSIDAAKVIEFASGLNSPNGVALHGSDLYVAEATRVIKYTDAIATLKAMAAGTSQSAPTYTVIKADFPVQSNHYWKYLAIGPDEKIYVPIGADCNVCLPEDRTKAAGIFRMNLDGSSFEQIAKGVRNSVGFDFHPATGELWFTDNGRDNLGDDIPSDELNHIVTTPADFGFPYCFANSIIDPDFGGGFTCNEEQFTKPVLELGAHVAALGMGFYRGISFPKTYRDQIFIAEHGSWNKSKKSGYRVRAVVKNPDTTAPVAFVDQEFISGWLDDKTQINWGRPVDVKTYFDGSLLISDDFSGVIYRVTYENATTR